MNFPSNDTKLNNNTHIGTRAKPRSRGLFCSNTKPCFRDICDYCWGRRMKFMTDQLADKANEWKLEQMVTVLVVHDFDHPQEGLRCLIKLRPKVLRKLRILTKTISVISVAPQNGLAYPHFHILTAEIDEGVIKDLLQKALPFKQNIIVKMYGGDRVNRMKRALAYMLKKNLRPTLLYKAKGMRLLSSSRGFFTGRPSYKGPFRWLI